MYEIPEPNLTHSNLVQHYSTLTDMGGGPDTNIIESIWWHSRASLPDYNRRKSRFSGYLVDKSSEHQYQQMLALW
jgi:hypothetical protein